VAEGPTPRGEQTRAQGVDARQLMHAYVGEQLEIRRREKRDDDLIGKIAMSPVALERSEREIRTNVTGLVVAGHDTTPRLLAHMFVTLARHPEQREAIREDRSLIPQAIEEIIRYDGVSSSGSRAARVDTEIGGLGLRAGDKIIVLPTAPTAIRGGGTTPTRSTSFVRPSRTSRSAWGRTCASASTLPRRGRGNARPSVGSPAPVANRPG
jgi:cytochrome P450